MIEELKLVLEAVSGLQEGAMYAFIIYISYLLIAKLIGLYAFIFTVKIIHKCVLKINGPKYSAEELSLINDAKLSHQETCEHHYRYPSIDDDCTKCGKNNGIER